MRLCIVLTIGMLALITESGHSSETSITQSGSIICQTPDGAGSWLCPSVTFNQPFGCPPEITLSVTGRRGGISRPRRGPSASLKPFFVTSSGFQPVIVSPSGPVSGPRAPDLDRCRPFTVDGNR